MEKVRYGIIGIVNMGSGHCKSLLGGLVPSGELTAVCDTDPKKLEAAGTFLTEKVRRFENTEQFFKESGVDAVMIATPHYLHPPLVIEALSHGINAISEKPAGVYTKAVREMNAIAEKSGKLFGLMFNQRTNPLYQKVRDLLQSGELGEMRRVNWIITNWYRPQSYYDSGDWRASWAGEGGGVLLNQSPHQLDLWQWICGMPKSIRAFMSYGKFHTIEVEDDVTAYAEYENGATGVYITSTCDAPGTNRLEISGNQGRLVVENDTLTFFRNRVGEREFNASCKASFGAPECWECKIPVKPLAGAQHPIVLENFAQAILKGTPLLAPGVEGIKGLTISNAMHLSDWTGSAVELAKLDEDLYYQLLSEKIGKSTYKKPTVSGQVTIVG